MNWNTKLSRTLVKMLVVPALFVGVAALVAVMAITLRRSPAAGALSPEAAEVEAPAPARAPSKATALGFDPRAMLTKDAPADEDALPAAPDEKDDPEAVRRAMHDAFNALWQRHRYIDSKEREAEVYDELLASPAARSEAVAIVSDLAHAEEAYGEDQAVVRVQALRMLRHAAEQGDAEIIEQALDDLSQHISAADTLRRGQGEDYASLVKSYIIALGDEGVLNEPKAFFEAIGYSSKVAVELHRGIYDSGIGQRVPEARLLEVLGPYIAELEGKSEGRANL